jgi:hypothetical protein
VKTIGKRNRKSKPPKRLMMAMTDINQMIWRISIYFPYQSNYTNLESENQMGDTMLRLPTLITPEKNYVEILASSPIRYKIPTARLN